MNWSKVCSEDKSQYDAGMLACDQQPSTVVWGASVVPGAEPAPAPFPGRRYTPDPYAITFFE